MGRLAVCRTYSDTAAWRREAPRPRLSDRQSPPHNPPSNKHSIRPACPPAIETGALSAAPPNGIAPAFRRRAPPSGHFSGLDMDGRIEMPFQAATSPTPISTPDYSAWGNFFRLSNSGGTFFPPSPEGEPNRGASFPMEMSWKTIGGITALAEDPFTMATGSNGFRKPEVP